LAEKEFHPRKFTNQLKPFTNLGNYALLQLWCKKSHLGKKKPAGKCRHFHEIKLNPGNQVLKDPGFSISYACQIILVFYKYRTTDWVQDLVCVLVIREFGLFLNSNGCGSLMKGFTPSSKRGPKVL
jgi:hypothetical protein